MPTPGFEPIYFNSEDLRYRALMYFLCLFSLSTLSFLLYSACRGSFLLSLLCNKPHNTHIHALGLIFWGGGFCLCTLSLLLWLNCPGFAFCPYCTTQTSMSPTGFEPAIPASNRPQTLALDHCFVRSYFIRSVLFIHCVTLYPLSSCLLFLYNIQYQYPCFRRDFFCCLYFICTSLS